jgi:hypothetical protein
MKLTMQNSGQTPALVARDGNTVQLERVTFLPPRDAQYTLEQIDTVRTGP